jgi:iron complex outermembrane receptor protein
MKHYPRRALPAAMAALFALPAVAADTFQLGTVEVVGKAPASGGETIIDAAQLERFNADTVGQAVSRIPGLSLSHNSRNEDMVYLRGFDVRQVPLFIDGIPTYVPYDGYVDFGRFTTFDLAEVRVAKGAASLLYGPNALGGAINLVTRKPVRALEGDVRIGVASGSLTKVAANVGSNQGRWYVQLGASWLDADTFPLSGDLKPTTAEDGGDRNNAYRTDKRLSFKLGFTPGGNDEYAVGYVRQEGEKGNPPYAGAAPGGLRYWRWPYWNVESTYALANVGIGSSHVIKARVYDDTYRNSINAYTDGSYATQLNNTSFPSWYDDGSRGASLELTSYAVGGHEIRVAWHYKEDRHKESNPNIPPKQFKDVTTSLAAEDAIALAAGWRLRLGLGHDRRDTKEAFTYMLGDTSRNNALAELSHDFGNSIEGYASAARKSRFPTIKDRYSFRLGTALYNPALRPETADNFDIGLKARPWAGGHVEAAVFVSRIQDLMQSAVVSAPNMCASGPTPNVTCNQLQNIGTARHSGIELAVEHRAASWSAGGGYTYLDRENRSNPAIPLTDTPRDRLFAHVGWKPAEAWEVQGTAEAESGRKVGFGNGYRTLPGVVIVGAKGVWTPRHDVTVEAGVANLFDRNYELADGYPMPGRTWFANAKYAF